MNSHFFPIILLLSTLLFSSCALRSTSSSKVSTEKTSIKIDDNQEANYLSDILQKRYSGRLYDSKKMVSMDDVKAIVQAGILAPSSYNEQPWRFIVCDKQTNPEAYAKALSTLVEFNQGWAQHAPVLIIIIADSKSPHYENVNPHAQYDTGAAAGFMMLKATSLDLMTHQMGGFDAKKVSELFGIDNSFVTMAVMAVGYALPADKKAPKKERKPLDEVCFLGEWHN